ncbi:MAG: HopJ type III effector protein [Pseudomonadota bacterium]
MPLNEFLSTLISNPLDITFTNTIAVIDANYLFTATAFRNGELQNEAGQNSGSCKLFSFAQLHKLTKEQTLQCFGDYYRIDVQQKPTANDHQNIRNFMQFGWEGIEFSGQALS